MKNHILGFGLSKFEQPINSYSISSNWDESTSVTVENVTEVINKTMKTFYGDENYKDAKKVISVIHQVWEVKDKEQLQDIYKQAKDDCTKFLKEIKVCK